MSTIAESPTASPASRNVNLRTFLAGGTATTALIAGAVIVFASLATYVAFNELSGGEEADSTATVPAQRLAGAPEAAAAGAGGAPAAVAATPAAPTAIAPAPAPPLASELLVAEGPPAGNPGDPDVIRTVDPRTSQGDAMPQTGALGGAVSGLEGTTGNLGLDAPLGDLTRPITGPLDETLNDTLNNVGGLLGNPDLGDQVTTGLSQTTGALLGPGGLTDQILGGLQGK
jgi:hypothetical protein